MQRSVLCAARNRFVFSVLRRRVSLRIRAPMTRKALHELSPRVELPDGATSNLVSSLGTGVGITFGAISVWTHLQTARSRYRDVGQANEDRPRRARAADQLNFDLFKRNCEYESRVFSMLVPSALNQLVACTL